jgi:hypothetical protein
MPTSTPSVEAVLTAVKTAIDALPSIGTSITSDQTIEDDVDFLDNLGLLASSSMDLWVIELRGSAELEGGGQGEKYEIYSVWVRYWSIRTGDAEWSKKARLNAEAVRETLSGNANVFRIGGQVQITDTPETVQLESHGRRTISGTEGPQMLYESILSLEVEARRWG